MQGKKMLFGFLAGLFILLFCFRPGPIWAASFGLEDIEALALDLASKPFEDTKGNVPEVLKHLSYDQWRDIRFVPEKSIWRAEKLPFELQFFHPGLFYDRTVTINIVEQNVPSRLDFDTESFTYGQNAFAQELPANMGYAGFRVHAAINKKSYLDEFLVFLGASYFRAVGKGQHYGLSARGLAIDTADPKGEEFPFFKEFWIQKPGKKSPDLTIYALLDSRRVTGAFCFKVTPGAETIMDVNSTLFLRESVTTLGIAPLTSMFIFGENSNVRVGDDFRPEVHDSDGLMALLANDEWLWRPLQNPKTLTVNTFHAPNLQGMGLMQRDTDYNNYQDLEALYQARPSAWIEPQGEWGPGSLQLVQIPSPEEIHDNIVSFWSPESLPGIGQPVRFDYKIRWTPPQRVVSPKGQVIFTRQAKGKKSNSHMFVLEFQGGKLEDLPDDAALDANVWIGAGGKLLNKRVQRNNITGSWRLIFEVEHDSAPAFSVLLPDKRPLTEMRASLHHGLTPLTETWTYAVRF
ncbi:MAG: glucan biosynthesis protein G [Desulfomicrobium sp.]|nr:glucan biosynthesis protein G [Desulfomicrobium sp.]NLV97229.1 glucan biosynthesis protein G [Desulfovibrionales bacterium]